MLDLLDLIAWILTIAATIGGLYWFGRLTWGVWVGFVELIGIVAAALIRGRSGPANQSDQPDWPAWMDDDFPRPDSQHGKPRRWEQQLDDIIRKAEKQ